jgi:hypothetical protein
MTRFTSIVSTLALVPTTLALASPALASLVDDVEASPRIVTAETERYDLNCDGVISEPDERIARRVVEIHSSPDFNPAQAVEDNSGATRKALGRRFPYEADLNGDCKVDEGDDTLLAQVQVQAQAQTQDLLAVLASHFGTDGESEVDFNCDGTVGLPDYALVGQVIAAQHAPHFDPVVAVTLAWETEVGHEDYHPAADDGDCVIGLPDFANAVGAPAAEQ